MAFRLRRQQFRSAISISNFDAWHTPVLAANGASCQSLSALRVAVRRFKRPP
jgi:hypothetical protein